MPTVPRAIVGAEVVIAFTTIASIILVARLYTRYVLVKNPGHEELAIVFAWVCLRFLLVNSFIYFLSVVFDVVHTSLVCLQIWRGLGDDVWNLSGVQQEHIFLPFWVSVPMYSVSLFLTKVSILLLYLRLFPHPRFVRACWITIAVMGAFLFWTIFGFMFMCTPVRYFWDRSIEGHCFNPEWVYFTNAPFNIVTDFVLFGLPLPILRELQLPRRQKTGLIILFAIGLVGTLSSILRLRSLYILAVSTNITHDNLDIAIWSVVEVNVGIICACGPTLKPLINAVVPRLLSKGPSKTSQRARRTTYGINLPSLDVNSAKKSQSTMSFAKFDKYSEIQIPEAGKVRVTTAVRQEVDTDEERLVNTVEDVGIAKAAYRGQENV